MKPHSSFIVFVAIVLVSSTGKCQEELPNSDSIQTIVTSFGSDNGLTFDAKIVVPAERDRNGYGILMLGGGYGNDLDWSSPGFVEDQGRKIPVTISGKVHADAPLVARKLAEHGFVVMHWGTFKPADASRDIWPNEATSHPIRDLLMFSKSALAHFREQQLFPDDRVILLGHSLGAVRVANIAAEDDRIAALVFLAPAQLTRTSAHDPGKNENRKIAQEFIRSIDLDCNGTCSQTEYLLWAQQQSIEKYPGTCSPDRQMLLPISGGQTPAHAFLGGPTPARERLDHPLASQSFQNLDFFADGELADWEVSAGFARNNRSKPDFKDLAKTDSSGLRWTEDILQEQPTQTLVVYGALDSAQAHHAPIISALIQSEQLTHISVSVVPGVGHALGPVEKNLVGPISQESIQVVSQWLINRFPADRSR